MKKSLDISKKLGGENYVFWGGREGYESLLNTDTKFELDNMAKLFKMVIHYSNVIQHFPQFLIEPKPKEPMKHQYDFDVMTTVAFIYKYGLLGKFKLNIEANHATLAGHTFEHELKILDEVKENRYKSFEETIGKKIVNEQVGLEELTEYALKNKDVVCKSNHLESLKHELNTQIF